MARGEKPYRVYRGGRIRGPVPLERRRREDAKPGPEADGRARYKGPGPKRRRRWTWRRGILVGLLVLFLLVIVWGVASYLSFRSGVAAANDRLDRRTQRALVPQSGLLLSKPTHILVMGTDHARTGGRRGLRHSDSIMVIRTDPDHHRLYYLSILRDLRVEVPGHGTQKINAAFQFGGPSLAVRTVRAVTGLPINHVIIVDFADFRDLIDELGGITVDVPRPILSNKFDCPYPRARCGRWPGWRFRKGKQKMDGRRALVYSRIRENRLNPADSDASRAGRQQQVVQAVSDKLTSPWTLLKLPFIGDDVPKPLATDMSAGQLIQFGWVKFRAGTTFHCRLGGEPAGGYIVQNEDSVKVLLMVKGRSAPQPPPPGNLFGSGCSRRLVLGAR